MFFLKNKLFSKKLSKSKQDYFKVIFVTSLFWLLVDSFVLLFYLGENNLSSSSAESLSNTKSIEATKDDVSSRAVSTTLLLTKKNPDEFKRKLRIVKLKQFETTSKEIIKSTTTSSTSSTSTRSIVQWFKEDGVANTNPSNWPGENGRAVILEGVLKADADKHFKDNQFNIVASDLIALNRSVPDQRAEVCRAREYRTDLPTTSIIIVYHNEGNSTLLRGLTSIVRNSPLRYLNEIVLVDDASEGRDYLHKPLDEFVKTLPVPVKIFRNKERMGLIRSRLVGAEAAVGDTLTFLDAHIEATTGWLPPLLSEIKTNRKAVPCPVIDIINHDNFQYMTGSNSIVGGFSKDFVFNWDPVTKEEFSGMSMPLRSPTMAGGLFTIDRSYFYELGSYDKGMNIWGAENLEMSFRIWMCGGVLLIVQCSHVGHIFRDTSPYSFPGGVDKIVFHNMRRVIDVWTDEYSKYLYGKMPHIKNYEVGDLEERKRLRQKLECKSFKWYLTNIYPNAPVPVFYFHVGRIENLGSKLCLDTYGNTQDSKPGVFSCEPKGSPNQIFEYSKSFRLVSSEKCIHSNNKLILHSGCSDSLEFKWNYDNTTKQFINQQTLDCLLFDLESKNLITKNCDPNDQLQKWTFTKPLLPV